MKSPAFVSSVARSVPFDNLTNGFAATNVQAAIEESQKTVTSTYLHSTTTVSTTSATYGTIADMTVTPAAGTWIVLFTCSFRSAGVNTLGNVAAFVAGTQLTETTRQQYDEAAILGLVTLSTNQGASSGAFVFRRAFTGSEQLTIRFNETQGGTTFIDSRTMVLMQVGI